MWLLPRELRLEHGERARILEGREPAEEASIERLRRPHDVEHRLQDRHEAGRDAGIVGPRDDLVQPPRCVGPAGWPRRREEARHIRLVARGLDLEPARGTLLDRWTPAIDP